MILGTLTPIFGLQGREDIRQGLLRACGGSEFVFQRTIHQQVSQKTIDFGKFCRYYRT